MKPSERLFRISPNIEDTDRADCRDNCWAGYRTGKTAGRLLY